MQTDLQLAPGEVQDYQSVYVTLWEKYRKGKKAQLESIVDDIEFEMELVKQVEVGIDYILSLVAEYHAGNCEDKEIRADIDRAIAAAPTLRDKKELIDKFIDGVNVTGTSREAWVAFVSKERDAELKRIMDEERLDELEDLRHHAPRPGRGLRPRDGHRRDGHPAQGRRWIAVQQGIDWTRGKP